MYDTIVIGAGPAGMTAALYAARANLKVATLEQGAPGGQMNNTSDIENYPGFESISGPELSMKMFEPLEKLGVENLYGIVSGIEDKGDYKVVKTGDEEYQTKTVIIATGAKHRHIGVAGEEEYNSRGVSYCAVCDGVKTGEVTNHEFGGVFVYVGLDPVSDYLTGLDITDQDGWVITDDKMATRIPGIFAIGDVRQKDLRQITTAVGDGATAGIEAYNYVTALGDK